MKASFIITVVLTSISVITASGFAEDRPGALLPGEISPAASGFVGPDQLTGALFRPGKSELWEPRSNGEVSRGVDGEIYAHAGPAVVVVRVDQVFGTGFLIDSEGWIVTNEHVASEGLLDLSTGARVVNIHFGQYRDRLMHIDRQAYPAVVYATDKEHDLALLRLAKKPPYLSEIRPIPLADTGAAPGEECIAIGHPTAGLLWTMRSGDVAGVGDWPQEHIAAVITSLAASGASKGQAEKSLSHVPKRRVVLSTCPINPGDSGGPLLNTDGELVGVTFGMPNTGSDQNVSLDKFSYHVHVDELKPFIHNKPDAPEVSVPSPWPPAILGDLQDTDEDGRWDTWSFAIEQGGDKTGIMLDLDQDTQPAFKESYATDPKRREMWDCEFALTFHPFPRAFYDTDNDGAMNLILADVNRDRVADLALEKKGAAWQRVEMPEQQVLDPSLMKQAPMKVRLRQMLGMGE